MYLDISERNNLIENAIKEQGYKKDGSYIYAYKSTRIGGYSLYNFQYKYEIGKEYESHADHNLGNSNSFGLSAWTEEKALDYYSRGELYKVKIHINDIAAIVHDNQKLRCTKFMVVERVK